MFASTAEPLLITLSSHADSTVNTQVITKNRLNWIVTQGNGFGLGSGSQHVENASRGQFKMPIFGWKYSKPGLKGGGKVKKKKQEEKYLVDYIANKRSRNGQFEYLIYWAGYVDPTWEPEHRLKEDIPGMIHYFDVNLLNLVHIQQNENNVLHIEHEAIRRNAVDHMRKMYGACRVWKSELLRMQQMEGSNRNARGSFICEICQTTYNRKDRLVTHMRTHVEGAPSFVCDVCGKTFTKKSNLTRHQTKQHSSN